jgi:hypothetical protein
MSVKTRLQYLISKKYILSKINVDFDFITESGKGLFTKVRETIPEESKLYEEYDKWELKGKENTRLEDYLNEESLEYLKQNRKNKYMKLDNGSIVTGKHIVKCDWYLDVELKKISYKEFVNKKVGDIKILI